MLRGGGSNRLFCLTIASGVTRIANKKSEFLGTRTSANWFCMPFFGNGLEKIAQDKWFNYEN